MDAVAVHEAGAAHETHAKETFFRHYIFSTDHKMIGKQYFLTTMFMALVGGAMAMLMRDHLAWPDNGVLTPEQYLQAVTMHGTIMIFFFLTVMLTGGFGNLLIPLMIGARDMAFPVLNMISYWTFVPGVITILASFFVPGGPAGNGWTSYAPLSGGPGGGRRRRARADAVAGRAPVRRDLVPVRVAQLPHDDPEHAHPRPVDGPAAAHDLGHLHHRGAGAALVSGADGRRSGCCCSTGWPARASSSRRT